MDIEKLRVKDVLELWIIYYLTKSEYNHQLLVHCHTDTNDGDYLDYFNVVTLKEFLVTLIENAVRFKYTDIRDYNEAKMLEMYYHTNSTMFIRGLDEMTGNMNIYNLNMLTIDNIELLKSLFKAGTGIPGYYEYPEKLYKIYPDTRTMSNDEIIQEYSWVFFEEFRDELGKKLEKINESMRLTMDSLHLLDVEQPQTEENARRVKAYEINLDHHKMYSDSLIALIAELNSIASRFKLKE